MGEAETRNTTFPLFSNLPPELRNQIWQDALPNRVGAGLYFYKQGCCGPEWVSTLDGGSDHERSTRTMVLEFQHSLLDDARFDIPLAFVSREARSIALAWAEEQGLKVCSSANGPIFLCPFNPRRDVLYIAPDQWDGFLRDHIELWFGFGLIEQDPEIRSHLERVALPQSLLRSEFSTLLGLFNHYHDLKTLYIVADAPTRVDLPLGGKNDKTEIQQRWELALPQSVEAFVASGTWKSDSNGMVEMCQLIVDACDNLTPGIPAILLAKFEVLPIRVIRT
ncbi:hypothetical protein F4859DRAFT_216941 [Xylaria cf. heliscus]|nr:hypothetical protein F4859DRAFT_216941 [Xylaria cf. heliscus]